jgi:pSer/pThr/pTyr-binding forkhead associated (FHA) protein
VKDESDPGIHATLIPLAAETAGMEIVVGRWPVVLGRECADVVQVADPWVSRRHCRIGRVNSTLWIEDLGSRHGTFVNGALVREAVLLPGDKLTIGTSRFRVDYLGAGRRPHDERLERLNDERAQRVHYARLENLGFERT